MRASTLESQYAQCAIGHGQSAPERVGATPTQLWMQTQPPIALHRAAVLAIGAMDSREKEVGNDQASSASSTRVGSRPGVVCSCGVRIRRRACVRAGRPDHRIRGVSQATLGAVCSQRLPGWRENESAAFDIHTCKMLRVFLIWTWMDFSHHTDAFCIRPHAIIAHIVE